MPAPQSGPTGLQSDNIVALWSEPAMSVFWERKKSGRVPPNNPTFYYAVSFFPQDGYSIKQGATVNTLVAGP